MKNFLNGIYYATLLVLCFFGIHNYDYYMEEHKCIGVRHMDKINIRFKECTCCGKRWMHPSPACNGLLYHWKRTIIKENEVIKLVEL
jgi:hypothetical protein